MMHYLHPCLEFLDILLRHQGCIWWPAEQKICRQTKITSKEHLGWGIAGGLVNGTPVGNQEKRAISCPSPVDYWIPGERGCSGWSDRTSLPCRQIEDAKLLSWFCRWRVFHTVSCKLQNRSFSLDRSAVVEGPRIVRSSVELEPLQQLRPLGR
ncbi:hypothetical protein TNCV_4152161 [Trichonephila clavipes]|nr:hypothetical protein TNCV_4152161 [Trichonephila clavipes]